MTRTLLLALLPCLPAVAPAQDAAYRGVGGDLGFVLIEDAPRTAIEGFGTSDLHFGTLLGVQGEVGLQYLGADGDSRTAASIDLHPYARLGHGLAAGVYLMGWAADDSATALGAEIALERPSGFGAEIYFGQTWGDELEDDGYATSKGATLGYTFAHDLRGTLFFNKDTTSESGRTDRDYYDYGLELEAPVSADGATRLTASFGHTRFDAEGGPKPKLALGLTRQLGGSRDRPTFTHQRSVLTGLIGF